MLTRRELFAAPGAAAAAGRGKAGAAQTSGPGALYRDYSLCLPDYLRGLAEDAYRRRNRAIARLTTAEAIRSRQRWVRETFWKLVGGMPERTPLNARTTGSFEREGYRLEKVVWESQPNFHVSGNLYVPTRGRPPFPGVLFQMGHTANGKAGDLYQICCQALARLGYLVLGFDPMGQGERTYYPGPVPSVSRILGEEHNYPGRQMMLKGDTSTRLQAWDSVRALDYLASHPLVDPTRLASTGQSGGGTTTMFLAAVDDRLAAAAVCCGITENFACAGFNPPGSTDDAEHNILGSGPEGFDRWDMLYPLAPKPLLVLVSEKDFFGTYSPSYISSGREEFGKLQKIYRTLGRPERLEWFATPLPHGIAYDMRMRIYNWFARWLKGESRPVEEEPPARPEPEAALFVSPAGNVVRSFGGETPFSINRKRALRREPADLGRLLGADRPPEGARAVTLGQASFREVKIEALEFASAPGVWAPAWLYRPKEAQAGAPVVVVLEPQGRMGWREGELYDRLAAAGPVVCAPDLRGIGDLTPEFPRGAAHHWRKYANDENYGWASMVLGKPLVGQRVTDILAVVAGLRRRSDLAGRRVVVAARGFLTVPALFAAALEPAIEALYLAGGLVSFAAIVESEEYSHPFSNFVFNLLRHTDLPEVAAALAPRRVVLAGTVDATGSRIEAERVRAAYGEAANVEVQDRTEWNAPGILSLRL